MSNFSVIVELIVDAENEFEIRQHLCQLSVLKQKIVSIKDRFLFSDDAPDSQRLLKSASRA